MIAHVNVIIFTKPTHTFLTTLNYLQQQNEHLFAVDESIKNRIVDILPVGSNQKFNVLDLNELSLTHSLQAQ